MQRAALLALLLAGGCRYGLSIGASRIPGDSYGNKSLAYVEAGKYAENGFGGYAVFCLPQEREDNDSTHNSDTPWLMGQGRYRRPFVDLSERTRLYGAFAVGAGAGLGGVVTMAQPELGLELKSQPYSFDLSLRYAPIYIVGDDSPAYALMVGIAAGELR